MLEAKKINDFFLISKASSGVSVFYRVPRGPNPALGASKQ